MEHLIDESSLSPALKEFLENGWGSLKEMQDSQEHFVDDFPQSSFSPEMKEFLKNGVTWGSAKELQDSKTAQEKGWKIKVRTYFFVNVREQYPTVEVVIC